MKSEFNYTIIQYYVSDGSIYHIYALGLDINRAYQLISKYYQKDMKSGSRFIYRVFEIDEANKLPKKK